VFWFSHIDYWYCIITIIFIFLLFSFSILIHSARPLRYYATLISWCQLASHGRHWCRLPLIQSDCHYDISLADRPHTSDWPLHTPHIRHRTLRRCIVTAGHTCYTGQPHSFRHWYTYNRHAARLMMVFWRPHNNNTTTDWLSLYQSLPLRQPRFSYQLGYFLSFFLIGLVIISHCTHTYVTTQLIIIAFTHAIVLMIQPHITIAAFIDDSHYYHCADYTHTIIIKPLIDFLRDTPHYYPQPLILLPQAEAGCMIHMGHNTLKAIRACWQLAVLMIAAGGRATAITFTSWLLPPRLPHYWLHILHYSFIIIIDITPLR